MEQVDSAVSYITAGAALVFSFMVEASPAIMAVGGLVLLALRLFVDGRKAWREITRKE
ncbi:hypothetical protein [Stappia phage SI01]|uniref:Uncharacterized protein n=1 Tax=Stappia phage SI01 TaxID=2847766 RepID=A0AAE7SQM1_9CAUD|nr:hypothetical protein [Stappia phage SI01]